MNRLIEFMRKHCIITAFLGGIGVILIIKLGILILKKMIVFMIVKTRIAFCYIISRQFAAKMMQYSNISANKWLNVIFCYLELCMGFVVIWFLVTMFMAVISVIVEKTYNGIII